MGRARRFFLTAAFAGLVGAGLGGVVQAADAPDPGDWQSVLEDAGGETVYFNAWAGEARINDFIAWVGNRVKEEYGVTLVHVKIDDAAAVVSRVLAEKTAGKTEGGSVDLIWINGENFAAMKRQNLLMTPGWADRLPNFKDVDVEGKPTVVNDFTVPTEGLEAPWGMAQLVFYYDSARLPEPPRSPEALLEWAKKNPGRFTYPQPPDFTGSTFLKQALIGLVDDPVVLQKPVEEADFDAETAPLFAFLDELHPVMWRSGRAFPQNASALRQLIADGETDIAFSFTQSEASSAIARSELPDTVRSFVFEDGTIGNTHFVAIPFNANARAGALVVADFLMSPEAQAEKQKPEVWGDFTVLDVAGLDADDRALFDDIDLGVATLSPAELGAALPEPHPSWMVRLEEAWTKRYGAQ
ncbi:putative thiamine transport system substrate-binding protein [Rhodobium orientis]|uniref:ABC transporter substrate-binding protein n=1 Tax=Rhodobium orientis TaxID=34017 RepID=A0A327JQI8_9HYPH|nr:ABC transporter substrate-binding protein [Rhodobium orientis]MBB4302028.1 putative thiamine transport system substrate-binding protein [Rhodobium orientis]MBK5950265.1 ABC transporter substrate-binding protein [Rhodobium orientis]RAI27142.1 ABC transporter substrate-binding protein [Rhodobium orientis]